MKTKAQAKDAQEEYVYPVFVGAEYQRALEIVNLRNAVKRQDRGLDWIMKQALWAYGKRLERKQEQKLGKKKAAELKERKKALEESSGVATSSGERGLRPVDE